MFDSANALILPVSCVLFASSTKCTESLWLLKSVPLLESSERQQFRDQVLV
jgi:hypothetical protein